MRDRPSATKRTQNLDEIEGECLIGGVAGQVRDEAGVARPFVRGGEEEGEADAESEAEAKARYLEEAQHGLLRRNPEFSAAVQFWPWQTWAIRFVAVIAVAALVVAPDGAVAGLYLVLALPFLFVAVVRLLALWHLATGSGNRPEAGVPEVSDPAVLPRYCVLVPLYHEAEVVPGLVEALGRLNYPAEKLQVLLILEIGDVETRAAVEAATLPETMQIVLVPDGAPRTKPRALNYALNFSVGDYVVVYDAEDVPDPDQLHQALALFRSGPSRLGCVQARLNVYNARKSALTRQFTIEYTALFDIILPVLERLSLPVPLGGTSNHFPRAVLDGVGGWDPFNVTEDADLGIRLERAGWRARVLNSTTWEEAPAGFRSWLGQRTRWLKGWMQTWLVHTRQPVRLWRELGPWKFFGVQMLMCGMILAALAHPWFYVLIAYDWWTGRLFVPSGTVFGRAMLWLGVFNLAAGYLGAILLGVFAVRRRGNADLAWSVVWTPIYWLGISVAAYRALWQIVVAPHLWEKTQHSARDAADNAST